MNPIDIVCQFLVENFGDVNVDKRGSHLVELNVGSFKHYFVLGSDLYLRSNFRINLRHIQHGKVIDSVGFEGSLYDPEFFDKLLAIVEVWRGSHSKGVSVDEVFGG